MACPDFRDVGVLGLEVIGFRAKFRGYGFRDYEGFGVVGFGVRGFSGFTFVGFLGGLGI